MTNLDFHICHDGANPDYSMTPSFQSDWCPSLGPEIRKKTIFYTMSAQFHYCKKRSASIRFWTFLDGLDARLDDSGASRTPDQRVANFA